MTPIELIKIHQQKQQQHLYQHHHHTTHDVAGAQRTSPARAIALHVYRLGGIRGLYRGLSATILRDVGGYGLYFFGVCLSASSAINHLSVLTPDSVRFPHNPNPSTKARCASSPHLRTTQRHIQAHGRRFSSRVGRRESSAGWERSPST